MTSAQGLFKALGSPTSHSILALLVHGERCACEIPGRIRRTQSNTSMHLMKLQRLGLVQARKEGKKHIYSIKDKRVARLFAAVEARR